MWPQYLVSDDILFMINLFSVSVFYLLFRKLSLTCGVGERQVKIEGMLTTALIFSSRLSLIFSSALLSSPSSEIKNKLFSHPEGRHGVEGLALWVNCFILFSIFRQMCIVA